MCTECTGKKSSAVQLSLHQQFNNLVYISTLNIYVTEYVCLLRWCIFHSGFL